MFESPTPTLTTTLNYKFDLCIDNMRSQRSHSIYGFKGIGGTSVDKIQLYQLYTMFLYSFLAIVQIKTEPRTQLLHDGCCFI